MLKKVFVGMCVASSLMFAQNEFDINVNNDTLEVGANIYMNDFYMLDDSSKYYLGASYLGSEEDNQNTQNVMSINFKVMNSMSDNYGFSLGMGIKAVYADNGYNSFTAIPLGLFLKYEFNDRLHFDGEIHYAPNILSFSDADNYKDTRVKANFKVVENGYAYVGARRMSSDYKGIDVEFDKAVFAGFKFLF